MTKLPFPLTSEASKGESHFWAPHVIKVDDTYYMYYCAGSIEGHDKYRIHLATSKDLYTWKKHPENPMVIDGFDARDPMVLRINNEWVMYYTCNTAPDGGNHCVAAVHSDDLIHWSNKQIVFVDPETGTYAGPCESPFVVKLENWYFLFIGPRRDYSDTDVFASKDPFDFHIENKVGNIKSHAAEIIQIDDRYYITRCGWGQGGVYLAPLIFELS